MLQLISHIRALFSSLRLVSRVVSLLKRLAELLQSDRLGQIAVHAARQTARGKIGAARAQRSTHVTNRAERWVNSCRTSGQCGPWRAARRAPPPKCHR